MKERNLDGFSAQCSIKSGDPERNRNFRFRSKSWSQRECISQRLGAARVRGQAVSRHRETSTPAILFFPAIQISLRRFNQLTNPPRVRLFVTVTRQRVAAAARFDQNIRPDDPRLDMHRRDLGDADADLVLAEPRALVPDDSLVRHLDDGGEKKISVRPAARFEKFRSHSRTLNQSAESGNCNCAPTNDCKNHFKKSCCKICISSLTASINSPRSSELFSEADKSTGALIASAYRFVNASRSSFWPSERSSSRTFFTRIFALEIFFSATPALNSSALTFFNNPHSNFLQRFGRFS